MKESSSKENVREIIHRIACRVVAGLREDSDGPLDRESTMLEVCRANNVEVEYGSAVESSYHPIAEADGSPGGCARIDGDADEKARVRQYAHELCHHHLIWYRMIYSQEAKLLEEAGLRPEDIEERICRKVEDLVSALPGGMQWNGKLAPPRAPVTARHFRRVRTPNFMAYNGDFSKDGCDDATNRSPEEEQEEAVRKAFEAAWKMHLGCRHRRW